jgi:molybdate transport system substrate-binding protein
VRRPGAAVALTLAIAGCGGGDDPEPRLVVSAASSMTEALTECGRDFEGADVRLSFGGSDELAAQVRQLVKPDVLASANTTIPAELHDEGLLSTPVEFATNRLVIAVPRGSDVREPADLGRRGMAIVIGSESVPIGAYTREMLDRLPGEEGERILANVRSNEPDVKGIVGKLTQGAADAGFTYATDVTAAGEALGAIPLPPALEPDVTYAAGVVRGAEEPELARRFVDELVEGGCAGALANAGFGKP